MHVGADMSGTIHWATNAKAHGVLRELLHLGVSHEQNKDEWEGCTSCSMKVFAETRAGLFIDWNSG